MPALVESCKIPALVEERAGPGLSRRSGLQAKLILLTEPGEGNHRPDLLIVRILISRPPPPIHRHEVAPSALEKSAHARKVIPERCEVQRELPLLVLLRGSGILLGFRISVVALCFR